MKIGLYSQCMGGNSQYHAIHRRPDLFENVLCMCSPMVVSIAAIYSAMSELQGVSQYQELIDLELLKMGAFVAAEMTPHLWAAGVKMPVLMSKCCRTHGQGTPRTHKRPSNCSAASRRSSSGLRAPTAVSKTVTITSEGIQKKLSPSSTST